MYYSLYNNYYYVAFQNSLFWLVDKRSVKTHIRTVVRIFRIWTGVPDVVYLAGNFCFANRKNFCFLMFQLCVKQPNCFWLSMHAYRILLPSETTVVKLTIADLIRAKSICSQTQFSHIINRLLTSLVRSVLWNITKKPRSDISQYRPHARSISRYYLVKYFHLNEKFILLKDSSDRIGILYQNSDRIRQFRIGLDFKH
jgi:hypothetical protein